MLSIDILARFLAEITAEIGFNDRRGIRRYILDHRMSGLADDLMAIYM